MGIGLGGGAVEKAWDYALGKKKSEPSKEARKVMDERGIKTENKTTSFFWAAIVLLLIIALIILLNGSLV